MTWHAKFCFSDNDARSFSLSMNNDCSDLREYLELYRFRAMDGLGKCFITFFSSLQINDDSRSSWDISSIICHMGFFLYYDW